MDSRELVTWNAIVGGYTSNGEWLKALHLLGNLVSLETLLPDSVTMVSILLACAQLKNLQVGKQIHAYTVRHPFLFYDTSVGNALVSFMQNVAIQKKHIILFFMILRKDLILRNSMFGAFGEKRHHSRFINLLNWMLKLGIRPDSVTILTIIRFCVSLLRVEKVKEIHNYSIRTGSLLSVTAATVGNAILDAYFKCGNMEYANKVFQNLSETRNLVTCNLLISGYVGLGSHHDANIIFSGMSETDLTTWNLMVRVFTENDCPELAHRLFHMLHARGMRPDMITIMSLLPDLHLEAALFDAYAKCGLIGHAYTIFKLSVDKDLVMFTAMIGGYAMHGMSEEALKIFSHMLMFGIQPDHIIFTSILSACVHAGRVDERLNIFYSIEKFHGMKPTVEQYACVVGLLARGGGISEAYSLVTSLPIEANANLWGTLLGACKTHHEVELGWDGVMEVRRMMRNKDLKKPAGCRWIEVERTSNIFVAGDCSHPQRSILYSTLHSWNQLVNDRSENFPFDTVEEDAKLKTTYFGLSMFYKPVIVIEVVFKDDVKTLNLTRSFKLTALEYREEIGGLKESFKMVDADKGGTITFDELKEGLKRVGSEPMESEIKVLVDALVIEENLVSAFSYFDKDGSGYVTIDEIWQPVRWVNGIFVVKDGQIDYGEFAAMMRKGNGGIGRRTMRSTLNFRDALGIVGHGSS
ncbi:unnamed protein product [Sphenostylis stenocarpa]|uniref:EF-hand domain-containing protein n=1 Tax=Sphenostylis stenocarpa TaxID=92480 RepID=A0AA86T656_9FABA|nr:unnamed protein product [Sphenostylis stenocarpa]